MEYQTSETTVCTDATAISPQEQFSRGYRQLLLFALRHWLCIISERPRLGPKRHANVSGRDYSPEVASVRLSWLAR